MRYSLYINDISNAEAKAFWEYAKTLKFVTIKEEENTLSEEQIDAIDEARISLRKNGGKSTEEVFAKMKLKYPKAF